MERERGERHGGGKDNAYMLTWVELRVEAWTVATSMLLLFTSSLAFRERKESKARFFISDTTDSLRWLMPVYYGKLQLS